MPRLDATRLDSWRHLSALTAQMTRLIDDDLRAEWDISLGWFEVLGALRDLGGRARPSAVAEQMRLPPSSVSRRLDRLEEEGWVQRHRSVDPYDGRIVEVETTRRGRNLWREMNITFRRSVQTHYASLLDDDQIAAVIGLNEVLRASLAPAVTVALDHPSDQPMWA